MEIRGALDIGSSQHKLVVAEVSKDNAIIHRILLERQCPVYLNDRLVAAGGKVLPEDVLEQSAKVLKELVESARLLGATQVAGVATAVFRKASNGQSYLKDITSKLQIHVVLVTQQIEGELGFWTACAAIQRSPSAQDSEPAPDGAAFDNLVAWDSGGGSFQLSTLPISSGSSRPSICVLQGPIGNADVLAMLSGIQKKVFESGKSPNPVSRNELEELLKGLDSVLSECFSDPSVEQAMAILRAKLVLDSTQVIGIGNHTSIFCVGRDASLKRRFSAEQIYHSAQALTTKSDADLLEYMSLRRNQIIGNEEKKTLNYAEVQTIIPKLALLCAVMRRLEISKVEYRQAMGSCAGVLLEPDFWSQNDEIATNSPIQHVSETESLQVPA